MENLQRVDGQKLGFKLPIWYPKDGKKIFSYPINCNNTHRNRTKYTGLAPFPSKKKKKSGAN